MIVVVYIFENDDVVVLHPNNNNNNGRYYYMNLCVLYCRHCAVLYDSLLVVCLVCVFKLKNVTTTIGNRRKDTRSSDDGTSHTVHIEHYPAHNQGIENSDEETSCVKCRFAS